MNDRRITYIAEWISDIPLWCHFGVLVCLMLTRTPWDALAYWLVVAVARGIARQGDDR